MTAQESRFAAFEQSAPSIFFVQPPPSPSNPSVFTLPPHQHHGQFPLFPAQQPSFFRSQPQHDFRFIPEQSSFSGLTHSFIPPVDRNKQQNRYLPSAGQSFEIHPSRQPLVRPLIGSQQYNEDPRPSLAPVTFPPQRSSPAPFRPFPEQRLPFLSNEAHQQPPFQHQFQHQSFQQQFTQQIQPQIQQPPILQQQDTPLTDQSHLQQRPIEKLRITRPYFEETRPTVANQNYGPQTFPTPHAYVDFPPTSFYFPEQTQTQLPTTTTTTTTTEAPEISATSSNPLPHINEVQPSELSETPATQKRKSPHHRRRKPNRPTTNATTPVPDVSRDDDFSATSPLSLLPDSVQYQQEVLLPQSDPTFEIVGTYQPSSAEPTQFQGHFQEQSTPAAEPSPTLPQIPETSSINHENNERVSNMPSTEVSITEETPAAFRPRRKKPAGLRHRHQEEVTTTPATPPEIFNHHLQQDISTTLPPQPEPSTEATLPSSTASSLSSRLRPRIRFNSTRPSFSLKEYRGRLNKPIPSEPESSSSAPVPSAIPPRVRYPSRVRSPHRPSATDEPAMSGNESNRTKSRFNPRYRTSTTTSPPDTLSSPTETSETKASHFKANMTRFRPSTGKYVSRFRLTSTTETAVTERTSRMPTRTTGVYSVRRPAPTEAAEVAPPQLTPHSPMDERPKQLENEPQQVESEDLETHPSNQPISEYTPESRSTISAGTLLEPSQKTPAETSENHADVSISNTQYPLNESYELPDVTAEAISVPPPEINIDAEPSSEDPPEQSTPDSIATPSPKATGTALEQDNEVLPAPSEPSEQVEISPDDMMLSPSSRVADLTSSPNNNYDNPQLRLKSAIPPRISLSTDDPILPIEAFFNSWNKGGKSS